MYPVSIIRTLMRSLRIRHATAYYSSISLSETEVLKTTGRGSTTAGHQHSDLYDCRVEFEMT